MRTDFSFKKSKMAPQNLGDAFAQLGATLKSRVVLEEAVRLGSARGSWHLGCFLVYNEPIDHLRGEALLREAVGRGVAEAGHSLALCVNYGIVSGTVAERNALLHSAASAGLEYSARMLVNLPPTLERGCNVRFKPPMVEPELNVRVTAAQEIGLDMYAQGLLTADEIVTFVYGDAAGASWQLVDHARVRAELVRMYSDRDEVLRLRSQLEASQGSYMRVNLGIEFYADDKSPSALASAGRNADHLEALLADALSSGDERRLDIVLHQIGHSHTLLMHTCLRMMHAALRANSAKGFSLRIDLSEGARGSLQRCVARPVRFCELEAFTEGMLADEVGRRAILNAGPGGIPFLAVFRNRDVLTYIVASVPASTTTSSLYVVVNEVSKYNVGTRVRVCWHCLQFAKKNLLRCARCSTANYCDAKCQRADWPRHKRACVASAGSRPVAQQSP